MKGGGGMVGCCGLLGRGIRSVIRFADGGFECCWLFWAWMGDERCGSGVGVLVIGLALSFSLVVLIVLDVAPGLTMLLWCRNLLW